MFLPRVLYIVTAATAMLALGTVAGADSVTVKTENGKTRGKLIHDGAVRAFLGIPYAVPPVSSMRWKAPQPVTAWKGEFDATQYGMRAEAR